MDFFHCVNLEHCQVHWHLDMGMYTFKRVNNFKYLGTLITQNNEIKNIEYAGNISFFGLSKMFKLMILSKNLKVKLYRTLILR